MSIAEITQQADTLTTDRAENYLSLAKRLSVDESAATPEEIADVLRDAAKTPDELLRLVCSLKECARIRQQIAEVPKMKERVSEIERAIIIENERLERAVEMHSKNCVPLQLEREKLGRLIAESGTLDSQLQNSCPDEKLRERRKRLERESPLLNAQVRKLENEQGQLAVALKEQYDEKLQSAAKRISAALEVARAASAKNWQESERIARQQIEF